ncbi:hypothetical protein N7492_001981 [Penicillium capsulatum]|uniref:Uncharacterized protein n=1 Tax=Penicillium capsulatum TaxID=69766 RepID=A0A9W9IN69_9EURO|nr:hypothetical protein N7492_001981 [Penicillium capsulatum]KAJ6123399.1 hypothetical protein N7512_005864 [Penicillium capsulatum]
MANSWPARPEHPGGTRLDIRTTAESTGPRRGKSLSTTEKATLLQVCQNYQGSQRFSGHTKAFWIHMSSLFADVSGREYSWQSCRRFMCAWEKANSESSLPSNSSPVVAPEAPPHESPVALSDDEVRVWPAASDDGSISVPVVPRCNASDNGLADDHASDGPRDSDTSDDDLLPKMAVPALRRTQPNAMRDAESRMSRADVCDLFLTRLDAFQSQLLGFTNAIADTPQDCQDMHIAFDNFRGEVAKSMCKYSRNSHDDVG